MSLTYIHVSCTVKVIVNYARLKNIETTGEGAEGGTITKKNAWPAGPSSWTAIYLFLI